MTALIVLLQPEAIMVFSDTVYTDADGRPMGFKSKVRPLPALRAVVSAVGPSSIVDEWAASLAARRIRDVLQVAERAEDELQKIWRRHTAAGLLKPGDETHIVLLRFGESPREHIFRRYSSRNGFSPEILGTNGIWCIPDVELPAEPLDLEAEVIAGIMERQRDCARAEGRPDSIGGEIHVTQLDSGGIRSATIYRFSDYDRIAAEIRSRNSGRSRDG